MIDLEGLDELKSKEEKFTYAWLKELEEAGYIKDIKYEIKSYVLCEPVVIQRFTKTGILHDYTLTVGRKYTPDFECTVLKPLKDTLQYKDQLVHGKAYKGLIVNRNPDNTGKLVIETKATHDANNMTREALVKISIVHDKYGDYVNLIKIPPYTHTNSGKSFFQDTFVPQLYEDWEDHRYKRNGRSKIKFNYFKVKEWLEIKNPE